MKPTFALLSNVERLMAGVTLVNQRGAAEAGMMLVTSAPGYGKTRTLQWYVTRQPHALYLRAKSGWTRHWFLSDLLTELGVGPLRLTEDMFKQAAAALVAKPFTLVIDEIEHALADTRVLEAIRDLSDLTEIPVVLVGMAEVQDKIRRHPQISSRIATVVHFQPVSLDDIKNAASALLEGGLVLSDDLLVEIHRVSEGRMRLVLNALGNCERLAKEQKSQRLTLADTKGQELVHDWQSKKKGSGKVVKLRREA